MSSLWDVPHYLIMAFSLAFHAPAEKASRVSLTSSAHSLIENASARAGADLLDDSAWLRAVKTAAPSSDALAIYGARIFQTSSGRYYVATQAERAEILALKANEEIAARVMAAATLQLTERLAAETGRRPSRGALLIAHAVGLEAAASYARALAHDPSARAVAAIPALAPVLRGHRTLTLAALDARLNAALGTDQDGMVAETAPRHMQAHNLMKGTLSAPAAQSSARLADAD